MTAVKPDDNQRPERLLSVREVAERTALSRTSVYELLLSRDLASLHIGTARRVREVDLDRWIRRRAEESGNAR
ncbi:MAG: hypothetical protein DLM71_06480 [Chloroflexi bacterium]|nr:MAG: hypothetical protein DLM71_06480 [Chloroflexota bacterium]